MSMQLRQENFERSSYVQSDTSNSANLGHAQGRQDPINDGALAGVLTRGQHRGPREYIDRDVLTFAQSNSDVDIVVLRLSNEDLGRV